MQSSPLKRPLILQSQESAEQMRSDLFATVEYSVSALAAATATPERWCEIVLLLSNTKACRTDANANASNNPDATPKNALWVAGSSSKSADATGATVTEFLLDTRASNSAYLSTGISAQEGPLGTHSIHMRLQAVALSPSRSFVHLHYSYKTSWMGRVAMQAYLQTLGRGKVGFTLLPAADGGTPGYIDGPRSVIERNTMRYFLGLECALAAAPQEPPQRFNSMVACWYSQIEKYPLQLHEMPRNAYLEMKAAQYRQ